MVEACEVSAEERRKGGTMDHECAPPANGPQESPIEHKVYARVGLLGNPSDVYFGRTISFSLANFWASVLLHPSHDLLIRPHPTHDLVQFTSLDHLVRDSLPLFFLIYSYLFINFIIQSIGFV